MLNEKFKTKFEKKTKMMFEKMIRKLNEHDETHYSFVFFDLKKCEYEYVLSARNTFEKDISCTEISFGKYVQAHKQFLEEFSSLEKYIESEVKYCVEIYVDEYMDEIEKHIEENCDDIENLNFFKNILTTEYMLEIAIRNVDKIAAAKKKFKWLVKICENELENSKNWKFNKKEILRKSVSIANLLANLTKAEKISK